MQSDATYKLTPAYSREFYEKLHDGMLSSAEEIVPLVSKLIAPESVVDIGCGAGAWLSVWKKHGVDDILGVDGEYVESDLLLIRPQEYMAADLTLPLAIDRQFDLVVSLEVAEHLPPACAEAFVNTLTSLGKVVLFSAAIPFQGGVNHVNEQWPEYWHQIFEGRNYSVIDCLRRQVWKNPRVKPWYAQNILLYVHNDYLAQRKHLLVEKERTSIEQLALVHPYYLEATVAEAKEELEEAVRRLKSESSD